MPMQTYEALLSSPQHVAQAHAARRAIEGVGGALRVIPNPRTGMTLIVLTLPMPHHPDEFVPGLPLYPV